jgi:hypothetical protein
VLTARSKSEAYALLEPHTFAEPPPPPASARAKPQLPSTVEGLPAPFVKGIGQALGLSANWMPAFIVRMQLKDHVRKLREADAVLAKLPLETVTGYEVSSDIPQHFVHVVDLTTTTFGCAIRFVGAVTLATMVRCKQQV